MAKREHPACCCSACGNCTKSPTYDMRTDCCCSECGHCFKPARVEYRGYPWIVGAPTYIPALPQPTWVRPTPLQPYTITYSNSANNAPHSLVSNVAGAPQMLDGVCRSLN